jgi:sugar O-acyltransferase (sialic acid O-acetyltransferase NeuD family)
MNKLIIVGAGETGEIACHYFERDTEYNVVAFVVEKKYLDKTEILGKPVIAFEDLMKSCPPDEYELYVALAYGRVNTQRAKMFKMCKQMGYKFASYISPYAYVDDTASIGENSFIFEDNTIQYHVSIGDDTVLWSGNHIGHRSIIGDHCWLTSHVVVSGLCIIGDYSFIGVNVTLGDHVDIPRESWLAAGSLLVRSPENVSGRIYMGAPAKIAGQTIYEKFDVKKEDFR